MGLGEVRPEARRPEHGEVGRAGQEAAGARLGTEEEEGGEGERGVRWGPSVSDAAGEFADSNRFLRGGEELGWLA